MQSNTLEKFLDWPAPTVMSAAPSHCLLNLQDALHRTMHDAQTYLHTHTFERLERNEEAMAATAKFAIARLEWLLDDARQQISGMFSEGEFYVLLSCFQGEFLTPHECQRMAASLCDEFGVELDDYHGSGIAGLVDKLRALTVSQRVALADALEVAWHSERVTEVLPEMGIELQKRSA